MLCLFDFISKSVKACHTLVFILCSVKLRKIRLFSTCFLTSTKNCDVKLLSMAKHRGELKNIQQSLLKISELHRYY